MQEPTTSNEHSDLLKNNMIKYCRYRMDVVGCVVDRLKSLPKDSQLTMTIRQAELGGYFVSTAIDM